MGQSLVKNYIHLIFITKYRTPFIQPLFQKEIHGYLCAKCKDLECPTIAIAGAEEHVHILCMLSQKIPLMKLVEYVKSKSSKWIKTKDSSLQNFYWQDGYGAFSVNPSEKEKIISYISNQKIRHQFV
ncbi:IS200/IS605 family transposase [Sporocytophaga myxococcoides]|uniref:IS200/IS605 family transposase n=1 Tax=Sporocytophaga myxococcoides TaxID=153721 RepID=UPI00040B6DF5|nr:IS200/IS605 family transposase [Sporocytophaga myxococcoides]